MVCIRISSAPAPYCWLLGQTVGWALPGLINGATIISVVLSLPTAGPLLLNALMVQDMYLAASFVLLLSALTIIGTLLSDLMLAWLDPRIRLGAV